MASETLAQRLAHQGAYQDARQYNSLKESDEKERAATRELFESLKRMHGEAAALAMLKAKGFDTGLL